MVSSDLIRKDLACIRPSDRGQPEHYAGSFSRLVYAELGRRAAAQACAHRGVIAEATFRRRHDREAFAGTFGDTALMLFAECRASRRVLIARAAAGERNAARISDATAQVVARRGLVSRRHASDGGISPRDRRLAPLRAVWA